MALNELQLMVLRIGRRCLADRTNLSLNNIHAAVARQPGGEVYSRSEVKEAIHDLAPLLKKRAERDRRLGQMFEEMRQPPTAREIQRSKNASDEPIKIQIKSLTQAGRATEYMSPNEMSRIVTIIKRKGTTWADAIKALGKRYRFDPDLMQVPANDSINSYSVRLDRGKAFQTLYELKLQHGESQVNALIFSLGESFQRLKGKSLLGFMGQDGNIVYFDVPVQPFTAKVYAGSSSAGQLVSSTHSGVFGFSINPLREILHASIS